MTSLLSQADPVFPPVNFEGRTRTAEEVGTKIDQLIASMEQRHRNNKVKFLHKPDCRLSKMFRQIEKKRVQGYVFKKPNAD